MDNVTCQEVVATVERPAIIPGSLVRLSRGTSYRTWPYDDCGGHGEVAGPTLTREDLALVVAMSGERWPYAFIVWSRPDGAGSMGWAEARVLETSR